MIQLCSRHIFRVARGLVAVVTMVSFLASDLARAYPAGETPVKVSASGTLLPRTMFTALDKTGPFSAVLTRWIEGATLSSAFDDLSLDSVEFVVDRMLETLLNVHPDGKDLRKKVKKLGTATDGQFFIVIDDSFLLRYFNQNIKNLPLLPKDFPGQDREVSVRKEATLNGYLKYQVLDIGDDPPVKGAGWGPGTPHIDQPMDDAPAGRTGSSGAEAVENKIKKAIKADPVLFLKTGRDAAIKCRLDLRNWGTMNGDILINISPDRSELKANPELKELEAKADHILVPEGTFGRITANVIFPEGEPVLLIEEIQPSYGYRKLVGMNGKNKKKYCRWKNALIERVAEVAKKAGIKDVYASTPERMTRELKESNGGYLGATKLQLRHNYHDPFVKGWKKEEVNFSIVTGSDDPGKTETLWRLEKYPGRFDAGAAIRYILGLFEADPARKRLPRRQDVAEHLKVSPAKTFRNWDGILKRLQRASRDERVRTAIAMSRDLDGTVMRYSARYIRDLFADPDRKWLPDHREIADRLGVTRKVVGDRWDRILQRLKRDKDKRLQRAIDLDTDFDDALVRHAAAHILELFEKDPGREELPSQNEVAAAIGVSAQSVSLVDRWERVLEKLDRDGDERVRDAVEAHKRDAVFYQELEEVAVGYITSRFVKEPSRKRLPHIREIADALEVHESTVSGRFGAILEKLKGKGLERISKAVTLYDEDIERSIFRRVIEMFGNEPARRDIPIQYAIARDLEISPSTVSAHFESVLDRLEKRGGKRIKEAVILRRSTPKAIAYCVAGLFEKESWRRRLPLQYDVADLLDVSRATISRCWKEALRLLDDEADERLRRAIAVNRGIEEDEEEELNEEEEEAIQALREKARQKRETDKVVRRFKRKKILGEIRQLEKRAEKEANVGHEGAAGEWIDEALALEDGLRKEGIVVPGARDRLEGKLAAYEDRMRRALKKERKKNGIIDTRTSHHSPTAGWGPGTPHIDQPMDDADGYDRIENFVYKINDAFYKVIDDLRLRKEEYKGKECIFASWLLSRLISWEFDLPVGGDEPFRVEVVSGQFSDEKSAPFYHRWVAVYLGEDTPSLYIDAAYGQFDDRYRNGILAGPYEESLVKFSLTGSREVFREKLMQFVKRNGMDMTFEGALEYLDALKKVTDYNNPMVSFYERYLHDERIRYSDDEKTRNGYMENFSASTEELIRTALERLKSVSRQKTEVVPSSGTIGDSASLSLPDKDLVGEFAKKLKETSGFLYANGLVNVTPLIEMRRLSEMTGKRVFLKDESGQKGGAFKIRGIAARIGEVIEERIGDMVTDESLRGNPFYIVTQTDGNHGIATVEATRLLIEKFREMYPELADSIEMIEPVIFGIDGMPAVKKNRMREALNEYRKTVRDGSRGYVNLSFRSYAAAKKQREYFLEKKSSDAAYIEHGGWTIMAGHGSAGTEIDRQLREFGISEDVKVAVIVPVGAGGPVGVGVALKAARANASAVIVQTERYAAFVKSLEKGELVDNVENPSPSAVIKGKNVVFEDGIAVDRSEEEAVRLAQEGIDAAVIVDSLLTLQRTAPLMYLDIEEAKRGIGAEIGGTSSATGEALIEYYKDLPAIKDSNVVVLFGTEGNIDPDTTAYIAELAAGERAGEELTFEEAAKKEDPAGFGPGTPHIDQPMDDVEEAQDLSPERSDRIAIAARSLNHGPATDSNIDLSAYSQFLAVLDEDLSDMELTSPKEVLGYEAIRKFVKESTILSRALVEEARVTKERPASAEEYDRWLKGLTRLKEMSAAKRNELIDIRETIKRQLEEGVTDDESRNMLMSTLDRSVQLITKVAAIFENRVRFVKGEVLREEVSLKEVMTAIWGKHPRIDVDVSVREPMFIEGDTITLFNAIANLVINAEKHSQAENIKVTLGEEGGSFIVRIEDDGVGLPAEFMEDGSHGRKVLFDLNVTTDGTGLGLAETWYAMKDHGGTIEVESEPGKGTVFIMRFPVADTGEAGWGPGTPHIDQPMDDEDDIVRDGEAPYEVMSEALYEAMSEEERTFEAAIMKIAKERKLRPDLDKLSDAKIVGKNGKEVHLFSDLEGYKNWVEGVILKTDDVGILARAYSSLGKMHEIEENLSEAEKCFRKAISLDLSVKGPYLDLARILMHERTAEKSGEAVEMCREALEAHPGWKEAEHMLELVRNEMPGVEGVQGDGMLDKRAERDSEPREKQAKDLSGDDIREMMDEIIPRLVNDLQVASAAAGRRGEKVILAIDDELIRGQQGGALSEIVDTLKHLSEMNDELAGFLSNVVIRRGEGSRLAADLGNLVERNGKVKKENILIITSEDNLEYFRGFEGVSAITGIDDSAITPELYYPLVEIIFFTVARTMGHRREDVLRWYSMIPNAGNMDDEDLWALYGDTASPRYKKTMVIRLIPGAEARTADRTIYHDIATYIRTRA